MLALITRCRELFGAQALLQQGRPALRDRDAVAGRQAVAEDENPVLRPGGDGEQGEK